MKSFNEAPANLPGNLFCFRLLRRGESGFNEAPANLPGNLENIHRVD